MHILIYSSHRSGSTYIESIMYEALHGFPGIDKIKLGEYFQFKNNKTVDDYLTEVQPYHNSVVRIRPHQLLAIAPEDLAKLKNSVDKCIVLKRRDIWDHALSVYIANETKYQYAVIDSMDNKPVIANIFNNTDLDITKLQNCYIGIVQDNYNLDQLTDVDHVIYYEDFLLDEKGHLENILGHDGKTVKQFTLQEKEKLFNNIEEAKDIILKNATSQLSMFEVSDIKTLELELSSNCNAGCPFCLRNFNGADVNRGYKVNSWTIDQFKQAFSPEFLSQLETVILEGNFGDPAMCMDMLPIVKYIRQNNPMAAIEIYTNGSLRTPDWWATLALYKPTVYFALDGLQGSHELHRINTDWNKIIDNAKSFISQGSGTAVWRLVKLSTNVLELPACRKLSEELGFDRFEIFNDSRVNTPVFSKDREFKYMIGDKPHSQNFEDHWKSYLESEKLSMEYTPPDYVDCYSKKRNYIYVDALGDVYPCCYMGHQPKTFEANGGFMRQQNKQINKLVYNNNIFNFSLAECIEWFSSIPYHWSSSRKNNQDRLAVCDRVCGKCKEKN